MGPYDLREVVIGDETMHIRPIRWSDDRFDEDRFRAACEGLGGSVCAHNVVVDGTCSDCGQPLPPYAGLAMRRARGG